AVRDDVGSAAAGAPHRVSRRTTLKQDAERITDCSGAIRPRPDEVPLHDVASGVADEQYAAEVVAGDDVASGGSRPADHVVAAEVDKHSAVPVAEVDGSGLVGADEVSLNDVVLRQRSRELDALELVCGDDVPCTGRRSANDVVAL